MVMKKKILIDLLENKLSFIKNIVKGIKKTVTKVGLLTNIKTDIKSILTIFKSLSLLLIIYEIK